MSSTKGYQPANYSKVDVSAINGMDSDLVVVFTGGSGFRGRPGNMRTRVMQLAEQPGKAYDFKDICRKAATIGDKKGTGASPAQVRSGLFLHKYAKPAVYIACRKDEKGRLVAAWDYGQVRLANGQDITLKAGDVLPLKGAPASKGKQPSRKAGGRKPKGKAARA